MIPLTEIIVTMDKIGQGVRSCLIGPRVALALGIFLAIHVGCGKGPDPLYKTYPVTGQISDRSDQPIIVGTVQFVALSNRNLQALGEVQSDGSFSLTTFLDHTALPGAIEGAHEVSYLPNTASQLPFVFKEPRQVGTNENHFEFALPSKLPRTSLSEKR